MSLVPVPTHDATPMVPCDVPITAFDFDLGALSTVTCQRPAYHPANHEAILPNGTLLVDCGELNS